MNVNVNVDVNASTSISLCGNPNKDIHTVFRGRTAKPPAESRTTKSPTKQLMFCRSLSLVLLETTVYLRGHPRDTQTTNLLRGFVRLELARPIVVHAITVQLVGTAKTLWPEADHWDKQVLVDSTLQVSCTPQQLGKGTHRFPFEVLLSNALSESIECSYGRISYKLHCQALVRAFPWPCLLPLRTKIPVELVRLPPTEGPNSVSLTRVLGNNHTLAVTIETTNLVPGALLPVSLSLQTLLSLTTTTTTTTTTSSSSSSSLSNNQNKNTPLVLTSLTVKLIERQRIRAPAHYTTRLHHHQITLTPHSPFTSPCQIKPSGDQINETRILYRVPSKESLLLHTSSTNRNMRVRHWLQIFMSFVLPDNTLHDIMVDTPVLVLPGTLHDPSSFSLPVYQPTAPSLRSPSSTYPFGWLTRLISRNTKPLIIPPHYTTYQ
ncbi:hypothetical protein J3Q64DRAFT_1885316 [Phycomyces blakesleeanus]|uniref:Arrestin-like N-terminal domain-containing protein n=1 Tax=Phycomyces blakesleeanus TaxID=4837 RepID=A0ABR3B1S9_PHYBL